MKNALTYSALVILAFVAVVSILAIFDNARTNAAVARENRITELELRMERDTRPFCDCDGLHCAFGEPNDRYIMTDDMGGTLYIYDGEALYHVSGDVHERSEFAFIQLGWGVEVWAFSDAGGLFCHFAIHIYNIEFYPQF